MSSTLNAVEPPATRVRWRVFSLAFATSGILYWHRYVFAFVKPTLASEWQLSNTELGRLDSAFSLSYTLFQFPFGVAADVLGVHLVLSGLILLWCLGLGLLACAPSVRWVWIAQTLLGTGQSAVYACLTRIARVWFPPVFRTTMQSLVSVLAGRLGALSSSLVFTSVLLGILGLDWRSAIGILVAVGVVHALIFAMIFRDAPRAHRGVNAAELWLIEGVAVSTTASPSPASRPGGRRAISRRSAINLACLGLQTILSTFADNIYSNWIPLFLSQVHRLEFKKMGVYAALPLLGGALAGLLGGLLNDRLIARTGNRRWTRSGVALVGKMLAAAFLLAALGWYERPYAFCVMLFFVKLFGDWSVTSTLGVVTDIGGRATASVFAFNNTVAGIGLIGAPLVFGYLADEFGWRTVFATVSVTYVLCALSWLAIDCTIPVTTERDE